MPDSPNAPTLRIAQVAPLWTAVPPSTYGGAELMVHWLTEELVRQGHDVTLFASGDSETSATLEVVTERHMIDAMGRGEAYAYEPYAAACLAQALRRAADFDVVHCHLGPSTIPTSALSPTPVLHTVHAGLDSVDEHWVLEHFPEVPIAAISRSQISTVPSHRGNMRVVYHGCDFDTYDASFSPQEYVAFLGRMGPHKNPVGAIEIAKATGIPIVIAGAPQDGGEKRYFEAQVAPLVDGKTVVYKSGLSHREKVDLLRGARALIFPIDWEEHFGLVMIEAMACGTPVLATHRGSVPEVVDPGLTGYIGDSLDELKTLLPKTVQLDRRRLWDHALQRFSHRRMATDYIGLYNTLATGSTL